MRSDNSLQKELYDVPPVPDDAFRNIEQRIYQNSFSYKIVVSLAMLLLLVAGAFTFVHFINDKGGQTALADEVIEELDNARDFINGDESYQDSDVLAVLVNDTGY